jgi:small subunit ribosomal protein S9
MPEIKIDNPGNPGKTAATKETRPTQNPAKKEPDKGGYCWGTGRRKTSVARVRIRPGGGKLLVNDRAAEDYFKCQQDRKMILSPLKAVEGENKFDVFVNVRGGGTTGQAGAVLLGIARALKNYDANYMQMLRDGGYLTRDPRMVERKKPGQSGARKRYQFSKR